MLRLARGRAGQTDGGADRTLLAVGLVLSAALCFMATNGATKYLSAGMSAQQILWIRDGVVLVILIPLVWRAGGRRRLRTRRPFLHVFRGLLLLGAGLLFVSALGKLPLELCTALTYVAPLVTTHPCYQRHARRERSEWPPTGCSPGSPWTADSLRFGNRLRRTCGCGSILRLSA